jgi:dipeptidyl aminopeptidase/acylaminoacyl peptidase
MQDDVTDGVRFLVARQTADPRRICIVGASYGGYAALAGAAFTPDLYACAASIGGVSDLPMMLGTVRSGAGKDSDQLAYWQSHIGDARDADVIAMSPANSVASIRAPILLVHGTDDTVVPIAQSELIDRRLTELNKPHRFVRLTGEDHWLSRGSTRIRMLTELDAFLAEHLQAPPAR